MTNPKISIILSVRNEERFLGEAIQSILAQTYRDFELIIWDDASTDNTWSIIEQYNDNRILAFRNDIQRFVTYNVNKAFSEIAVGEYISLHDADDVWEPEKLEKQMNFLEQHLEIGAVFSWANIIDDNGNLDNDSPIRKLFVQSNRTRHEWLRYFFTTGNALCNPSVLVRKQCLDDCGTNNLAMWQFHDFDMWLRLCFKYEIHVLPEYLVKVRRKSDRSNSSAHSDLTFNRNCFEYYMMLNHYCNITSVEEFLRIFPSSEKHCIHPDADLDFALAMTAIEYDLSPIRRLFGLQLLHKLVSSPERAEKIRTVHHFDYRDFADITKQMSIFSMLSQKTPPVSQTFKPPLEKGIEAFNQEKHDIAIECLSTAMTQEPDNPLPYAYLAFVCARQGLLQEARDFIAQSIRLAPERSDLIAALGESFLKSGNPAEAVGYLREAVQMQPDLFAAYPALAQSLHLTGHSEEAVSLLKTASSLPSNAQSSIQNVLQQILAECGDDLS